MMPTFCRLSRGPGLGIIRRGSLLQEWILLTVPAGSQVSQSGSVRQASRADSHTNRGAQASPAPNQAASAPPSASGQGGHAAAAAPAAAAAAGGEACHRQGLQDLARSCGQLVWQLYLASAADVAPIQTCVSGASRPPRLMASTCTRARRLSASCPRADSLCHWG